MSLSRKPLLGTKRTSANEQGLKVSLLRGNAHIDSGHSNTRPRRRVHAGEHHPCATRRLPGMSHPRFLDADRGSDDNVTISRIAAGHVATTRSTSHMAVTCNAEAAASSMRML